MGLARSTGVTIVSAVLQLAITLITIPLYLSVIGLERYGVLVIVWITIEYSLVCNLGLDRALVNIVSRDGNDRREKKQLFWTAFVVCLLPALAGAISLYLFLPYALKGFFSVSPELLLEVHHGYFALSITLFVALIGTIFSAVLQTEERFTQISIAQLTSSVVFQILPLCATALFKASLETALIAGSAARMLQTLAFLAFCVRSPFWNGKLVFSLKHVGPLMTYGGWTTITSIISPLVVNLDRMFISYFKGPVAVALYTLPYNLVMKAQIIPTSIGFTLFPRLSGAANVEERLRTANSGLFILAASLSLILVTGSFLIEPFLYKWIAPHASHQAVVVGQLLIIGIWINGLAFVPNTWLQATGKPDVVAKLHLLQVIPFGVIFFAAVQHFGIVGAAAAYVLRVLVDTLSILTLSKMLRFSIAKFWAPSGCILLCVLINVFVRPTLILSTLIYIFLLGALVVWLLKTTPENIRITAYKYFTRAR